MTADRLATVLGVAQVPMRTRLPNVTYADLLAKVAQQALNDAGLGAEEVDGLVLAMSPTTTLGIDDPQYWALRGLPGAQNFLGRVHTLAASGLSAVRLAASHIAAGRAQRVLVVAADLADETPDLIAAISLLTNPYEALPYPDSAAAAHAFQMAGYMAKHGLTERDMAHVIVKNRAAGALNENAQLREAITLDEVVHSPYLAWPVKRADASPRTSGAAAVLLGPGDLPGVGLAGFGSYSNSHPLGSRMGAGRNSSLFDGSDLAVAMRRAAAMAGLDVPAAAIGLAEVYASFGIVEIVSIEGLGLCEPGKAPGLIEAGHFDRTGALPVNPSGGATCGSPISATGLIRLVEATLQLRGTAGARQISRQPSHAVVAAIGGLFQFHEVGILCQ